MTALDRLLGISGMDPARAGLIHGISLADLCAVHGIDPARVGELDMGAVAQMVSAGIGPILSLPGMTYAPPPQVPGTALMTPGAAGAINASLLRERQRVALLAATKFQPTLPLGVDSDVVAPAGVAPGGLVIIAITPVEDLKIVDFTVDDDVAPFWAIADIKLGRHSVMMGSQPVPATRYLKNSQRSPFQSDKVKAGVPIQISAVNRSGEVKRFYASFDVIELAG
jgi:hypothetical protein